MTFLINLFFINIPQGMLVSIGAFALVVTLYLSKKDFWLTLACTFLLVSQITIFLNWDSARFVTIANIILCIAIIIAFQRRRFHAMVRSEVREMFKPDLTRESIITTQSLQHLPPIVSKWLIRSNIIGNPPISTLCLRQQGAMRTTENGKWLSFNAEQFVNTHSPGFIWNARVNYGLIPINARDKYLHGHGNMFIKGMYTIPIADSAGKEIDQGTLMRFLAEMMWFPTAALAPYIRWDYVSETSALGTIDNGLTSVSGVFSFEPNGDIKSFEGMRYRDVNHHYALQKWTVSVKSHRNFGSIRIADKCEVSWQTGKATFTWLKVEISEMKFSYGRPVDPCTKENNSAASQKELDHKSHA
jgi:hypothetical protein